MIFWKKNNPIIIGNMHAITVMSEWLMFNAETAIFQLYHGENKLQSYHHDDVRFIQDQHA